MAIGEEAEEFGIQSKRFSMEVLLRPVMKSMFSIWFCTSSSATYWTMGLRATGSISALRLVAGRTTVLCSVTGSIASNYPFRRQRKCGWNVVPEVAGQRLDHHLQSGWWEDSRSRLQDWVRDGHVTVNGRTAKSSLVLKGGEAIVVTPANLPPLRVEAEDLPLDVLYEDAGVIGINKRAGMVVHAGAGNHTGTMVSGVASCTGSGVVQRGRGSAAGDRAPLG